MSRIGCHPEAGTAFSASAHQALPPPVDSPADEAAYLAAYDGTMRFWPVPVEPPDIATRFGLTHRRLTVSPVPCRRARPQWEVP